MIRLLWMLLLRRMMMMNLLMMCCEFSYLHSRILQAWYEYGYG